MSKRNITIIENWKSLTSNCYGDAYMNLILWQGMASLGEAFITAPSTDILLANQSTSGIFFLESVVVVPCEEKTVRWKLKG